MKTCPYCQREIPEEATFCWYCTRELVARPERPEPEVRKTTNPWVLAAVGLIGLLILIGILSVVI